MPLGGWPAPTGTFTGGTWAVPGIFAAVLVVGLALGARRLLGRPDPPRARAIIDERFARGEISAEERAERLAEVGKGRRRAPDRLTVGLVAGGLAGVLAALAVGLWSGPGLMGHMMGEGAGSMMGGGPGRVGAAPAPGARDLRVTAREFSFDPSELRSQVGETVNITLENRGRMFHTLTIGGLGFELRAPGGGSITGSLRPDEPGTYAFICAVPGHAQAGMRGTLVVMR